MASPQIEEGFTKIANEIMDALCHIRIPGEERQVLDCILRKTYGWNKCEDAIALSQFMEMTGLKKPTVCRAINRLLSKKIIIIIEKDNEPAKLYKFIKDYHQWKPLSKKITLSKKIIGVIKKDNKSLSLLSTTKDTTKDTITKDKYIYKGKFKIPSLEEITIYCQQRKNEISPQTFIDHYISNGWMVGKNKMKDWKAAIRTWESRGGNNGNGKSGITGSTGQIAKKTGGAQSDGEPWPADKEY